jgi:hypothetical protein
MTNTATPPSPTKSYPVHYKTVAIDEQELFYREAGPTDAPVMLLLHGFPTSSNMFRNLIAKLAPNFHWTRRNGNTRMASQTVRFSIPQRGSWINTGSIGRTTTESNSTCFTTIERMFPFILNFRSSFANASRGH